jgi:hypothetical protein
MPHPYTTDSDERKYVPFILAMLAVILSIVISFLLKAVRFELPTWVDGPSTMAIYGLLYAGFRKRFWRLGVLHRTGFVKVPTLHGQWNGYTHSSFDGNEHEIAVQIIQDWTHMFITLNGAHSQSRSVVGSILVCDRVVLGYEFQNEPSPRARDTMHAHRGYARLELSTDGNVLSGDYYSGRDRQTIGSMYLEKQRKRRTRQARRM